MEFTWTDSDQTTYAERTIWNALKSALIADEGLCYYRYPIFSADRSRREPDFLILHREWGLYVIVCKAFNIDNIEHIDGPLWLMRNWEASSESPYIQAEDQMLIVSNKFTSESELRRGRSHVIEGHSFIALPSITRAEWR